MSVFDASMVPMIEMFIFETTTLLEQLDEILLESEKSKSMSQDNINEIFRIMHTIKGSSAMMGIESVSELAHRIEDMFFIIRENPHIMTENTSVIFDLLFKASDFLKSEVDSIQQSDDYSPADSSALIDQIIREVAVMKGEAPATAVVSSAPVATTAAPADMDFSFDDANALHHIRVFFEDGCQMENIRAFMLISMLRESCDYIDSDPPSPESNSAYSNDIVKNGLLLTFKSQTPLEDICSIIETSVNIKSYEVLDDVADAPGAKPVVLKDDDAQQGHPGEDQAPVQGSSAQTQGKTTSAGKQSLISVNQAKLDQLMDIMGEIVIAESMVASNPELKGLKLDNFYKSTRQLRKLTDQLQDVVMSIRMVPLSGVFQKMNRIVRDMNKKLGKEVELETIGGDTEVDKTINDVLADPFMHMIRNAMDHAIETPEERRALGKPEVGQLTLAAQNVGGEIVITLTDDGRGLSREKILAKAKKNGLLSKPESEYSDKEVFAMIMLAGFSTNETVTEFSGRGVGMDVVRKNVEKVNGSISVDSQKNAGTTFTIKIPLTLAIVDGMEIAVNHETFTIPITAIRQTFKLSEETEVIVDTTGAEMIMLRGECFSIIRLHKIYAIESEKTALADGIFLLVESGNKAACIFADDLIGEQQVVVKPFPSFLSRYDIKGAGLAGCTIMGDGSISLILDINSFLNKY
ncbi:MAG: chemotaxis protein CheA [Angelakisella sp.]